MGVGIHGEPGRRREKLANANAIIDELLEAVASDFPYSSGDDVALMINGLGGTPISELYILYGRAHQQLADRSINVTRSYVGEYCTSLDIAGASLTLVKLDDELNELFERTPRRWQFAFSSRTLWHSHRPTRRDRRQRRRPDSRPPRSAALRCRAPASRPPRPRGHRSGSGGDVVFSPAPGPGDRGDRRRRDRHCADDSGRPDRVRPRGSWEGQSVTYLAATEPVLFSEQIEAGDQDFAFPGGESLLDQVRRTRKALDLVTAGPGPALVVAHAGTIRAALIAVSHAPRRPRSASFPTGRRSRSPGELYEFRHRWFKKLRRGQKCTAPSLPARTNE